MAVYFASDMHLRLDHPDRGRRLAGWVEALEVEDALYLVGDVCDFWFSSRQRRCGALSCEGLKALAAFRSRGGMLTILPGNHDGSLGPFYEKELGARIVQGPCIVDVHGLRLHLVHGHLVGGRQPWKAGLESRAFIKIFENLPAALADRLDRKLESSNDNGRPLDEQRLIPHFRRYANGLAASADVVIFGHVHSARDDRTSRPRMIVLGGWHHGSSYLRIDEHGPELIVNPGRAPAPSADVTFPESSRPSIVSPERGASRDKP